MILELYDRVSTLIKQAYHVILELYDRVSYSHQAGVSCDTGAV